MALLVRVLSRQRPGRHTILSWQGLAEASRQLAKLAKMDATTRSHPRPRDYPKPDRLLRSRGQIRHDGSINAASPRSADDAAPSLVVKAEVLLDRNHFSPGEIDGRDGDNFRKALLAFQQAAVLQPRGSPSGNLERATQSSLAGLKKRSHLPG